MIKVSVVVPVYNAGHYIDRCAPSLLNQSMRAREYEVIYVNDGSTDDSAARIESVRRAHRNVRTVTQENSGWPGKPRNVGISMARGRYIQFVDQDDELAPEALERLYDLALREHSDIVIGKMGGSMAGSNPAFRHNASGPLSEVPAIETMTGHKMFRRRFLLQHGIRFPEGYWRGEDLLFVARCYVRAKRISILADYTCYFWNRRDDGQNTSSAPFDVAGHYARMGTVIQTIRDGVPPGDLQDALLRRFYRVEILSGVGDLCILDDSKTDRFETFQHARCVASSVFPPSVLAGMPAIQKLRGTLLEIGSYDGLQELARRVQSVRPQIDRREIFLDRDGRLRTLLRFWLTKANGEQLVVVKRGSQWFLDPEFVVDLPGIDDFPITDPLAYCDASLQLEDLERKVWWYPEGGLDIQLVAIDDGRYVVTAEGEFLIDPANAAAGHPLALGQYTVWFSGQILGLGRRRRLVMPPRLCGEQPRWIRVKGTGLASRLDWSSLEGSRLSLRIKERRLPGPVAPRAANRA